MTIIYFLIVIGILVFVHELGHFLMAKKNGVRVEKFSLGMGPKVVGYKKGDTEYVLSALPLGGYVKMAGENPDEEPTGAQDEFQQKTVWQRAQIAAAGSLMNIMLAFLVMPCVYLIGTYEEGPVRVGYVEKGTPADSAGFAAGDVIEKVNGKSVDEWTVAAAILDLNPDRDIKVLVERHGVRKTLTFRAPKVSEPGGELHGLVPDAPAKIGRVMSGMPAEKAGLQVHDRILSVNRTNVEYWSDFSRLVRESGGKRTKLLIQRGDERIDKYVTPVKSDGRYIVGLGRSIELEYVQYGLIDATKKGFFKTLQLFDLTFFTLKKLLTFSLSIKKIGGPVMIAQLSGKAAELGFSTFLKFLAIISISLGILNLLPIPVLDGGLLLFLAIEAIRKKPLSPKVMGVAQSVGAALLIMLIAVVSYNDVMRWFFR